MVANPARGRLNRENEYFPVPVRIGELDLVRQARLFRPAPARSFSILILNHQSSIWRLLAGFLPLSAAAFIYLFLPPYAIGSVPSLSSRAWCSLPRVGRQTSAALAGCM